MKSASPALIEFLNSSQQFCMADIYEIVLIDGTVLRYTSADMNLTLDGHSYSSSGPILSRSRTTAKIGLEVDELEVMVSATLDQTIAGVPWITCARTGVLDGAQLTLKRLFMPTWGDTSLGAVTLFVGNVADVDIDGITATLKIKSILELLNINLPKSVFQPGCIHTLFDHACTLDRAANTHAFAVNTAYGIPTTTFVPIAGLVSTPTYYELGVVLFTSGANAGISRSIKGQTGNFITLALPLPAAPSNGDSMLLTPGCDKRQSTCSSKFSNQNNFRGYPYIPSSETAA